MDSTDNTKQLVMPAEWQLHRATYLAWPHNNHTWPGPRLKQIQQFYLMLMGFILRHEDLFLLIPDDTVQQRIEQYLAREPLSRFKITYILEPYNDVWIRDYGPMFVQTRQDKLAVVDWEYNAWGGKYPPYESDNAIAKKLGDFQELSTYKPGLVLEGGGVDVNGSGSLLTTRSVLLNPNRNGRMSVADWEPILATYLGVDNIIWLDGGGVPGDDTDGHIDNIARFVNKNCIVATRADLSIRSKYLLLEKNYQQLCQYQSTYDIIPLPLPEVHSKEPTVDGSNQLPASYANFYLLNGAVVVPVFNVPEDQKALKTFQQLFPERQIYPLYSGDLIWGQGGIHCITRQMPSVPGKTAALENNHQHKSN